MSIFRLGMSIEEHEGLLRYSVNSLKELRHKVIDDLNEQDSYESPTLNVPSSYHLLLIIGGIGLASVLAISLIGFLALKYK